MTCSYMDGHLWPVVMVGDTQILFNTCTPASYATLYFVECRGDKIPIGVYNLISLISHYLLHRHWFSPSILFQEKVISTDTGFSLKSDITNNFPTQTFPLLDITMIFK